VTRSLASLRLEHGRVLEEFGALKAVLCQKEREMLDLAAQDTRLKETVASFEEQLKALEEKAGRNERRAILAEREVSFLQAMLVSFDSIPLDHFTETPHNRLAIAPKIPAKAPHHLTRRNSSG
jgi:mitotic spindle assembly checkpoint protein MAD1